MGKVILFLRTDQADCWLGLENNQKMHEFSWQAGRDLSDGLLKFLQQSLQEVNLTWQDLDGIVVFRGPGSYTSLRIGLTVTNTLASGLNIPIVGADGETWISSGRERLLAGENDKIVTPIYSQPVFITKPRK